jgi:hypothetical protein
VTGPTGTVALAPEFVAVLTASSEAVIVGVPPDTPLDAPPDPLSLQPARPPHTEKIMGRSARLGWPRHLIVDLREVQRVKAIPASTDNHVIWEIMVADRRARMILGFAQGVN